jgi:copper homeostasis protein
MTQSNIRIEACVESLKEAINAVQAGANQLEVCSNLQHDGLTPSISLVRSILKSNIDVLLIKFMIRPRKGDFNYSKNDFNQVIARNLTI